MVCNMASKAEAMDVDLAAIVQKEMMVIVEQEDKLRQMIKRLVSLCSALSNIYSVRVVRCFSNVLCY